MRERMPAYARSSHKVANQFQITHIVVADLTGYWETKCGLWLSKKETETFDGVQPVTCVSGCQ